MSADVCCEQQPSDTFLYKEMEEVCGTSYCPDEKAPDAPETDWFTAYETCQAMGARLCHESDLIAAKGTGCKFDHQMVWTQTSCLKKGEPGFHLIKGNLEKKVCRLPEKTIGYIRCCAEPCAVATPSQSPPLPPPPLPPSSPPPAPYTIPMVADKCCEQLDAGFKYKAVSDVCGKSYCPGGKPPSSSMTDWYAAYDACLSLGGELCHDNDLLAAKSTGCSFNKERVWTQTPCIKQDQPGFLTRLGGNLNDPECKWAHEIGGFIRCCARSC
eukprot:scaffold6195_cov428-Prasinococcus_capsulatus_cf.AAC.2